MTDNILWLENGPYHSDQPTITAIANGQLALYAAVIWVAAGSGEFQARVGTTTTAGDPDGAGIVVGPERATGYAADAAGDIVQLHLFSAGGIEKYLGEGTVTARAPLEFSATAGALQSQTAIAHAATYGGGTDATTNELKSGAAVAFAMTALSDGDYGLCDFRAGAVA